MPPSGPFQSKNKAGRDIAGHDINYTTNIGNRPSTLRQLAEKIKLDCEQDTHLRSFIDKLQHFVNVAAIAPSKDLEQKLRESGRENVILDATMLKERFAKKLYKQQFSEHAQELFAHILARIHSFFTMKIKPRISDNATRIEIDDLIHDDLLKSIYDEIGDCEAEIDFHDLLGMVYFLAGNCHISWT
jgi:hypothetical protein